MQNDNNALDLSVVIGDLKGNVISTDGRYIINGTDGTFNNGVIEIRKNVIKNTLEDFEINTEDLIVSAVSDEKAIKYPKIRIQAARTSIECPETIHNHDALGSLAAYAYNGADYVPSLSFSWNATDSNISPSSNEVAGTLYICMPSAIQNKTYDKIVKIFSDGSVSCPSIDSNLTGSVFDKKNNKMIDSKEGKIVGPIDTSTVRVTDFIKFPVYDNASSRNLAIPNPEMGMVVFVKDVNKLQVNTDGTVSSWTDLN